MSDKTVKIIRTLTGIILSALALVCAIALAVSCVQIYQSGSRPFTPERISDAWSSIAIFVWLFVACAIAGGVIDLLFPAPRKKQKGQPYPELRLAKIKARLARKQYPDELLLPLVKQEIYVKSMRITAVAVCTISASYPLIYLNNLDNFTSLDTQLNAQVIAAVLPSLCCAIIAMAFCYAVRLLSDASCESAILYAKAIMLIPAPAAEKKPIGKVSKSLPAYTTSVLQVVLIVVAVCMIVAGIFNGSMNDVLQKAIRICTECIGLG